MTPEREMIRCLLAAVEDLSGHRDRPPGEETVYDGLIRETRALLATPDTVEAIVAAMRLITKCFDAHRPDDTSPEEVEAAVTALNAAMRAYDAGKVEP